MITKEITSLQHPTVKHLVQVRIDKEYRQACKQVLICGHKLVDELGPRFPSLILITEKDFLPPSHIKAKEHLKVTEGILKKVTGLENPEPIAALVPLPENANLSRKSFILVLDGISDPGNLGTLIRTALALGWEGVFLTPSTCDPFNDKVIRATRGASFIIPLCQGTYEELFELIEKNHLHAFVADTKGSPVKGGQAYSSAALILGNEAQGVSSELKKRYTCISLPIHRIDSLNVAVAGGILMYVMKNPQLSLGIGTSK